MLMGLGKRSPLADRVPILIELGKKSGFISTEGMRGLGKRRQNFISDGGMMMGLGKRSMGDAGIANGGMMMGLGKRAGSWNNFIPNGGMSLGLGQENEGDHISGIDQRHIWQPVYY